VWNARDKNPYKHLLNVIHVGMQVTFKGFAPGSELTKVASYVDI